MSAMASSSSPFHQREFQHDIFLSFSGKDTRRGFTGHLYRALTRHEIETFRDDKSLKKGKDFPPELLSAIRESRGSIIVFSQGYALSRWCLYELVEIMNLRKERGHVVYPIFYHVQPSDLKRQMNSVGNAFVKHEKRYTKETMQSWRVALSEVADINGWTLTINQDESDIIDDIVEYIKSARLDAQFNIKGEIEKLKDELVEIRSVIDDAEERQIKDRSAKIWVTNLQILTCDLEDIVEEFESDIGMHHLMMEGRRDGSNKRTRLMMSDSYNNKMLYKINKVTDKLKNLEPQKNHLSLRMVHNFRGSERTEGRLQPTSVQTETQVYGRDKDKEAIIELLFRRDDNANFVIPIVGMGGIGKTTLAQLVYNDARVKSHFDLQVWVSVSDDFDVKRITKVILKAVNSKQHYGSDLNSLQEKLRKQLSKKRVLIVLDDVWNQDYQKWTILQSPFLAKISGSKVIVTTRNLSVSSIMGASQSHSLEVLSDDDCLSIFAQHALGASDFRHHLDLKEVAEKIVTKCNGLPLAAKILGGLLRTNLDLDAWEDILQSDTWKLPGDIIPALQLSYNHLPLNLKRCFAYCSLLPKGYEFLEEEIIFLWGAQGFLQVEEQGKQCAGDVGRKYFRDLLSRFLLQKSNKDNARFVMHDLINDLAQSVAGELYCRMEGDKQISKHTLHLSYMDRDYDDIRKFGGIHGATHLRTFLPLPLSSSHDPDYLLSNNVTDFLPNLRRLRVLSLRGYVIRSFNFIEDSKHLRYLDFSQTDLESLPKSITTLYNLETLLLEGCRRLQKLPSEMENLVNLHHLKLIGAEKLKGMPSNFGALTNLQLLSNFVVGNGEGYQIKELKDFSNLKGQLCISGLENVTEAEDALKANIHDKRGLDKLELIWSTDSKDRRGEVEKNVLDLLQPSKKLKELIIKNYYGAMLPNWLGDSSFNGLRSLCLKDCPNCLSLPSIGKLPLLEKVRIEGLESLTSVGAEFFGDNTKTPFPSLEILEFEYMPEWENWNLCEVNRDTKKFPKLRELLLEDCPKLSCSLPIEHLTSLEKLVIQNCEKLVISIQILPRLSELIIGGCDEVLYKDSEDHSSLQEISFDSISKLSTTFNELTWLRELVLWSCPNLISLSKNILPLNVEMLEICECKNLQFLLDEGESSSSNMSVSNACACVIEKLHIYDCPSLVFLSRGELPTGLEELKLDNCGSLVSLSCRDELPLPTSLKEVEIRSCPELESIAHEIQHNSFLESFIIDFCDKIRYLPQGLNKLSHLWRIRICNCSNLVCFPERGLPLPSRSTSPEESFPSLRDLSITGSNVYNSFTEWGIHRLTCLQSLKIFDADENAVSFPQEEIGVKLPSSLTTLYIIDFPKLETLSSNGFQNLTSLTTLRIQDCPNLKHLPEKNCLSSLLFFSIDNSRQLHKFWSNIAHVPCVKVNWPKLVPMAAKQRRYVPRSRIRKILNGRRHGKGSI